MARIEGCGLSFRREDYYPHGTSAKIRVSEELVEKAREAFDSEPSISFAYGEEQYKSRLRQMADRLMDIFR